MLMRYFTSLFAVIGVHVVTAQDFWKAQSKLVLKVLNKIPLFQKNNITF